MLALLALVGLIVWLGLTFILVYANHELRNRSQTLKLITEGQNVIVKFKDEVIAKQRQLIEEKMTKVVEEALTPKKKRDRPRKS